MRPRDPIEMEARESTGKAAPEDACPYCGEDWMDLLVYDDADTVVTCQHCGNKFPAPGI